MRKGEQTRTKMVQTASALIERQGYAATGLKQVLDESGTPRGSLYFHFPGGKEALAAAVIEARTVDFGGLLQTVMEQAPNARAAAEVSIDLLAQQFEASGCQSGCPVSAIAFEMSSTSEPLRMACRDAFQTWVNLIATLLVDEGMTNEAAQPRARSVLSAIEGALILCRAYGNRGPLDDLKTVVPALLGS